MEETKKESQVQKINLLRWARLPVEASLAATVFL